jgi:hypothetical protein
MYEHERDALVGKIGFRVSLIGRIAYHSRVYQFS